MVKPNLGNILNLQAIRGMIIGNDLDALLSASLLKSRLGWDIVGIYDYQNLWFDSNLAKDEFLKNLRSQSYLAVDLDIYRNYLPSIGHHILSIHQSDILPQHENTFNPNVINKITHENFKRKYPMGTVHFLMWILNEYPSFKRLGELLIWLADSTFINAQSHRFRENVKEWLQNSVQNRFLKHSFDEVDSELFEKDVLNIAFPELGKTGLAKGKGQVSSKYKKLQGYQCQWKNPNDSNDNIDKLLDIIENNIGWQKPQLPKNYSVIEGKRHSYKFSESENNQPEFLRKFLADKKAFSYVITNKFLLNYTTHIDFY